MAFTTLVSAVLSLVGSGSAFAAPSVLGSTLIPANVAGTFTSYIPKKHCQKSAHETCLIQVQLTVGKLTLVTVDAQGGIHPNTFVHPYDPPCQQYSRSYYQTMTDSASRGQEWSTEHQGAFLMNGCTPPVTVVAQNCTRNNHSGYYGGTNYSLSVTACYWYNNHSDNSQAWAEEDISVSAEKNSAINQDSYYQYIVCNDFGNIVTQYQSS